MNKFVCPFISSGANIIQCDPACKCLNNDGTCKIIGFIDNVDKMIKEKLLSKN